MSALLVKNSACGVQSGGRGAVVAELGVDAIKEE